MPDRTGPQGNQGADLGEVREGPQALVPSSPGKWTSITVSVSSGQVRAVKEKSRQECCFSLALDSAGMQAHGANCAS